MEMEALNNKLTAASNALNSQSTRGTKVPTVPSVFSKFVSTHPQLVVSKDGKQYLRAEAWQYLLSQVGLIPSCECITMVHTNGQGEQEFKGVKVEVTLMRKEDGTPLSKSMMVARCEEDWLKDKAEYAVYGLAQTRAISRAARNVFGWVAVEAGFEAVPWEEMQR